MAGREGQVGGGEERVYSFSGFRNLLPSMCIK